MFVTFIVVTKTYILFLIIMLQVVFGVLDKFKLLEPFKSRYKFKSR